MLGCRCCRGADGRRGGYWLAWGGLMVSGVVVAVVAPDFFSKFFSTFSPAVPTALRSLIGGGALWRRALRARVPLGWGGG